MQRGEYQDKDGQMRQEHGAKKALHVSVEVRKHHNSGSLRIRGSKD